MSKKSSLLFFMLCGAFFASAQVSNTAFKSEFLNAYAKYPAIPRGILEGVAYAQTRIRHVQGNEAGCSGMPQVHGVMGLIENGKGYFKESLELVSVLSRFSPQELKESPAHNIEGYACAYNFFIQSERIRAEGVYMHQHILKALSEIPAGKNKASDYALSCFTYEVFRFLDNPIFQEEYGFPDYDIDFVSIYGEENWAVLTSDQITIEPDRVSSGEGVIFKSDARSDEYDPAIWNAAPSCNYSSRAGVAISAVTVHTIQGSYAGAISWAQNCASNVSYHYVVRSSDGQVTQMVLEEDKAWHVGSENPYTIGIEHEGFVDDPIWYTEAMYSSSADLVRDITESGYGISPLRTYQGVATAGTLTLGACTRIKGHQHFPGASHTDPGINWDWEHYYQLINEDPEVEVLTASSGLLFDSGGAAENYEDDERLLYLIQPPGAATVHINVTSFSIEEDWDYLYIYDGADLSAPLLGTYTGTDIPDVLSSSGGSLLIEFRSDCGVTEEGWEFAWSTTEGTGDGDEIAPATEIATEDIWATEDFTASFSDWDDSLGSGVHYTFYQVIDYNGEEWRANQDRGFFSDNFDEVIHPDWETVSGTWLIDEETLLQQDEAVGNTNIFANLNQNEFDQYLYHWSGRIDGAGPDKRAGLHIMCDDPILTNRGNSYFVWFREDDDKVQIYKVIDDEFSLVTDADYAFSSGMWYDFKTVFDKTSGELIVWVNNVPILSWIDEAPLTEGEAVSFRSGNAKWSVNNFKVYHNRTDEAEVIVGVDGDARYQNPDPFTSAAKVKSIVIDSARNVSVIGQALIDVDWTAPIALDWLNDGLLPLDVDETTSLTELSAIWSVTSDPNSGVSRYWYSIGTIPGDADVVGWTDNWYGDTVTHAGLELTYGETYYFSVYAENGAGLNSDTIHSDGQLLVPPTEPPLAEFLPDKSELCGIDSIRLENGSDHATDFEWFIPDGSPSYSTAVNPYVQFGASGFYPVTLVATGPGGVDTLVMSIAVNIAAAPSAAFTPSAEVAHPDDAVITFENESVDADGYLWDFGDGDFSSDISPWHEFTAEGMYEVSLIAINGTCPNDTAFTTVWITSSIGVEEWDATSLTLFPNPTTNYLIISDINASVSAFDLMIQNAEGKTVLVVNDYIMGERINLPEMAGGTYFLSFTVENQNIVKTFVVE